MKQVFILLIICSCTSMIAQKQYAPLSTVWNYEGHEIDCNGNHIQYIVMREEVIDDKECSIIYSYSSNDIDQTFIKSPDSLIVWENENKVYFQQDDDFLLLYDFTAEVGDTIISFDPINRGHFSAIAFPESPTPVEIKKIVTEIETKTVGIQERKFFTVEPIDGIECFGSDIIIENIGSTNQMLAGDCNLYVAEGCFGGLVCYTNGQIGYQSDLTLAPFILPCDLIDSNEEVIQDLEIGLYPNPVVDHLQINIKEQLSSKTSFNIINVNGQSVYNHKLSQNSEIDLSNLNQGIYFYTISNNVNNILKQGKIIKH